eukprot:3304418-Ditylum_brightwellii.AAC.1
MASLFKPYMPTWHLLLYSDQMQSFIIATEFNQSTCWQRIDCFKPPYNNYLAVGSSNYKNHKIHKGLDIQG